MIHRVKHALHRSRHRERFRLLDELLHNQALSREQLLARQRQDLAEIVAHAAEQTPYYGEKYRGRGRSIAELPILLKDEVIAHRDEMLVRGCDRNALKIGNTGGSTGKPVSFYYDRHKHELMRAGMCRSYMGAGWQPGQKILNLWGAPQDIRGGRRLAKRLGDYLAAETTLPAYQYSEAHLGQWAAAIRSYRPVLLQGYASILAELAGHVLDNGILMPGTLLGVFSTAEALYGWQRERMERAFGCKVFNQYGSREIPNIACECRHGNLHVFTDMVYLESLPIDGEDRLIVTSVTNRLMPLIRYDIGDSGRLKEGDCSCGSPFPLMEMGLCRSNDIIRTPGGKRVYPSYFIHLLDGVAGISQYQFVQSAPDRLTLNLVSPGRVDGGLFPALQERIHREVDGRMVLEIRHVGEIGRTVSGKHRFVIGGLS